MVQFLLISYSLSKRRSYSIFLPEGGDYMQKIIIVLLVMGVFTFAGIAYAAAPDGGSGPFADVVVSFNQGAQKDGSEVLLVRSDPSQALGATDGQFVSLGTGGELILEFQNPNAIVDAIQIEEATAGVYAAESVDVWMSANGTNWYFAGSENFSGKVYLPDQLSCARYVRLVDATDYTLHADNADGYDVDSVEADEPGTCDVQGAVPTATPVPSISPEPSQPVSPPNPDEDTQEETESSSSTNDSDKKSTLSRSGPNCSVRTMYLTMELKENDKKAAAVEVTFRYNGVQKVVKTNNDGYAGTSFEYAGKGEVSAEAGGWPTQRMNVDELICDGSAVLGATTDGAVGGQVLGASTDTLAQTGTYPYEHLALLSSLITLAGSVFLKIVR
jgi:hypothetical protein